MNWIFTMFLSVTKVYTFFVLDSLKLSQKKIKEFVFYVQKQRRNQVLATVFTRLAFCDFFLFLALKRLTKTRTSATIGETTTT